MRREDVAGFAGGDDEARAVGIGEIVDAAKSAADCPGERPVGGGVGPAAAIERVVAAARRHGEVADPVEQRYVAVDAVLQQRDVLVPPFPLAHVGAVALNQQRQPFVEARDSVARQSGSGFPGASHHAGCAQQRQ